MDTKTKDPEAILDYQFDWGPWLDGDTITASTWLVTPGDGVTVQSQHFTDSSTTTVWVGGGVVGGAYVLTNRVTMTGGGWRVTRWC